MEKCEANFQRYELLFYEVKTIKEELISISDKISVNTFKKSLSIKNPNETIFSLMKIFYQVIKENLVTINKSESIINFSSNDEQYENISWDQITKNLKYLDFKNYLKFYVEESVPENFEIRSKESIDKAMPFMINYESIKKLLAKSNVELVKILDFVKANGNFIIKMNWIKTVYSDIVSKGNKINEMKSDLSNYENLIKKSDSCINQMEKELKDVDKKPAKSRNKDSTYYADTNITQSEKDKKIYDLNLIKCYGIDKRYSVTIQINSCNKMQYILLLKSKYKEKNNFIKDILMNKEGFENGTIPKYSEDVINQVINYFKKTHKRNSKTNDIQSSTSKTIIK